MRKNNLYTHLSKPHLTWIHKVLSLFIQSGSPLRNGKLRGTPSQVIRFDRIYPQRLTFGGGNGSTLPVGHLYKPSACQRILSWAEIAPNHPRAHPGGGLGGSRISRSLAFDHHITLHLGKGKFTWETPISNPKRNVKGFGAFPLRKGKEKGKKR